MLLMFYRYEPPYQSGVCLDRIPSCGPCLVLKFIVYFGDDDDDDGGGDDNVAEAAVAVVVTTTVIVVAIIMRVEHALCFVMSVCPTGRMERLGSHWTDFS